MNPRPCPDNIRARFNIWNFYLITAASPLSFLKEEYDDRLRYEPC